METFEFSCVREMRCRRIELAEEHAAQEERLAAGDAGQLGDEDPPPGE
jgi:hypothetical protein